MGADHVDDEVQPVQRCLPVAGHGDRPFGDDVAGVNRTRLEAGGIVEVAAEPHPGEPPGRSQVELDTPVVVALPEVERAVVDLAPPLLREHATVRTDDDIGVQREPCPELSLVGVSRRGDPLALRRRPVRVVLGNPPVQLKAAVVRCLAASAAEAVVMEVAVGEPGMA